MITTMWLELRLLLRFLKKAWKLRPLGIFFSCALGNVAKLVCCQSNQPSCVPLTAKPMNEWSLVIQFFTLKASMWYTSWDKQIANELDRLICNYKARVVLGGTGKALGRRPATSKGEIRTNAINVSTVMCFQIPPKSGQFLLFSESSNSIYVSSVRTFSCFSGDRIKPTTESFFPSLPKTRLVEF